jgi:hypothetical protein
MVQGDFSPVDAGCGRIYGKLLFRLISAVAELTHTRVIFER